MMLLDNMFYNHFDLMRPKVMVVSDKMYQEAQQKKLQARLDYLVEQKEHYEKYLAFRTEDGTIAAVTEMCSEGPTIRIFDITNA